MTKRLAFCFAATAFAFSAASVFAAGDQLITYEVPFLIKMSAGDPDVVIAKNGDLELIARCSYYSSYIIGDILGRSTKPYWNSSNNSFLPDGGESVVDSEICGDPCYINPIDDGTLLQYGTHFIGVDSETTGYGISIFDADCLIVGKAIIMRSCSKIDWKCIWGK